MSVIIWKYHPLGWRWVLSIELCIISLGSFHLHWIQKLLQCKNAKVDLHRSHNQPTQQAFWLVVALSHCLPLPLPPPLSLSTPPSPMYSWMGCLSLMVCLHWIDRKITLWIYPSCSRLPAFPLEHLVTFHAVRSWIPTFWFWSFQVRQSNSLSVVCDFFATSLLKNIIGIRRSKLFLFVSGKVWCFLIWKCAVYILCLIW